MTMTLTRLTSATLISSAMVMLASADLLAQTARTRYESAQAREVKARELLDQVDPAAAAHTEVIAEARAVVAAYEALVRRYPVSGYCDNALFNAASLSEVLHQRFGQRHDRDAALRLYRRIAAEYLQAH